MHMSAWSTLVAFLWYATTVRAQYYAIPGVHTGIGSTGSRPARLNILTLQNDAAQFSIYIQALRRMQSVAESDALSWFQVAGIHGRPYIDWNSIPHVSGAPLTGYCTHSSPLFATWHRPYLALFEQVLAQHAQTIAAQYPSASRAVYQAAADNLRIPFWDWGVNPDLPPVVTQTTVSIITPTGSATVNNPLYSYTFQTFPFNSSYFPSSDSYTQYRSTTRNSATSINSVLRRESLQRRTFQSFSRSTSFNGFSTTATQGTSIESAHNSVHGDIGFHMTLLTQSAFDPIFWLHHANIDRLTAMYQAINPSLYLTAMAEPQGTYTIRRGETVRSTTSLTPFTINSSGTFYTSDSSRALSTFGYTYPEIDDWSQSTAALQANVTASVNRLYNPTGAFTKRGSRKAPGSKLRTWSVSISISKQDLPTRSFVRLFLGEAPVDPVEWSTSDDLIASIFVNPPPKTVDGVTEEGIVVHDEVVIDEALKSKGFDGQNAKKVAEYLKTALQWRIQTIDGVEVPLTDVPSLKVAVKDETVTIPRSNTQLPKFSDEVRHPEVTKGRKGGWKGDAES